MDDLVVTGAVFEELKTGDHPLRIWVTGSGFAHIGREVVASVGDVAVQWLVLNPDSGGFSGLLGVVPPNGSRLRVGWSFASMSDTDIVFKRRRITWARPRPPALVTADAGIGHGPH
jgi:hypothetical protein